MTAGGRSPNAAAHARPPTPAVRSSASSASWASRRPARRAAVQDGRLAGLEREREVAPQVRQLVRDRAEDAVVVEPGLADRDDPRVARPRPTIRAQPASSTLAASCGWTPTAASSHGNRVDELERALARRDVPARDEDPLDAGQRARRRRPGRRRARTGRR